MTPRLGAAAAALAIGAFAAPAAAPAQDLPKPTPEILVAKGVVEHTVQSVIWESANGKRTSKTETWIASNRSLSRSTDAATGKLEGECLSTRSALRCYDPGRNVLMLGPPTPSGVFGSSWAREAKLIVQQVDMGWFTETGRERLGDRDVVVLSSTPSETPRGDDPTMRQTIYAEPGTLYPLKRVLDGRFDQVEEVVLREQLDPTKVDFALLPHPGARVQRIERGGRSAGDAAKRKAKAKGKRSTRRSSADR